MDKEKITPATPRTQIYNSLEIIYRESSQYRGPSHGLRESIQCHRSYQRKRVTIVVNGQLKEMAQLDRDCVNFMQIVEHTVSEGDQMSVNACSASWH